MTASYIYSLSAEQISEDLSWKFVLNWNKLAKQFQCFFTRTVTTTMGLYHSVTLRGPRKKIQIWRRFRNAYIWHTCIFDSFYTICLTHLSSTTNVFDWFGSKHNDVLFKQFSCLYREMFTFSWWETPVARENPSSPTGYEQRMAFLNALLVERSVKRVNSESVYFPLRHGNVPYN